MRGLIAGLRPVVVAAVMAICAAADAFGDIYQGSTSFDRTIVDNFYVGGNLGGLSLSSQQSATLATLETQVTTNWTTPSLTVDLGSLCIPGGSGSGSMAVTSGPGQEETFSVALTYDPLTIALSSSGTVLMSPGVNRLYNIGGPIASLPSTINLTGSYTITGPSDSTSGTFSEPLPTCNLWEGELGYSSLDTTNYPSSLVLSENLGGNVGWSMGNQTPFLSLNLDGEAITLGCDDRLNLFPAGGGTGNITLTPAPEPSSFILCIIEALTLLAYAWRRRRLAA